MIICEIEADPDNECDYYTQLYYYIPTSIGEDLINNSKLSLHSYMRYDRFKEFLIKITRLL